MGDLKKILGYVGCVGVVIVFAAFAAVWIGFHRGEEGDLTQGSTGLCKDVPMPYKSIFEAAGDKWKVQPAFIAGIFVGEWRSVADSNYKKWPDANQTNWDNSPRGAQGPFQFMPATWDSNKQDGNGDGKMDVQNLWDASFAAAHKLAMSGAGGNTTDLDKLRDAASKYNSGRPWSIGQGIRETSLYVPRVIAAYQQFYCVTIATGECAQKVVSFALAAVGDPTSKYLSSDPRHACAAFTSTILKEAGAINRKEASAQDLWDKFTSTEVIPKGANLNLSLLQPGDVVFFTATYDNGRYFTHVGIYIGNDHVVNTSSSKTKVVNNRLSTGEIGKFAGAKRFCK